MAAFYQVLEGLSGLHDAGFIHRDIKPSNIGVVKQTGNKIEIVILDYGETIRANQCEPLPGTVGTILFLAPEMELRPHHKEVDIWACGILGIQLFVTEGKLLWRNVINAEDTWKKQVASLKSAPANTVQSLLASMLAWDPTRRISADAVLSHSCFDDIRTEYELQDQEQSISGTNRKHAISD